MIGLKNHRRLATWLAGFAVMVVGLFLVAQPGHAISEGTIEGGKFVVDVKGTKIEINDENTTVTTSPKLPASSKVTIADGKIKIFNVPTGSYSVNVKFKFTKDLCTKNWFTKILALATPALTLFCATTDKGDAFFVLDKQFSATVEDKQTAYLGGTEATTEKLLGKSYRVDAAGNVIIECGAKGMILSFFVCPMIEAMLSMMDWLMNNFVAPFLAVNPLTPSVAGAENQLYTVWNTVRNLANIVFIAAFFAIVFSQTTSVGITNYGIKRLLPRLVLVAIGTNLSFFVCALLIDFFNVLGNGAASLLVSTFITGQPTVALGSGELLGSLFGSVSGGALTGAGSLLGEGLLSAGIIVAIFMFMFVGLITMIFGAIIVLLRQVAIVFLVILSPIAFVAGLLPNTQKMFSRWISTFAKLLAMYPIIVFIYAAAKVTSVLLGQIGI